jgi:anaerobic selenocysteine-containing dehydrogenase
MINGLGGSISRFANVYQGTLLGVSVDQAMPLGVSQVGLNYYGGGNEAEDIADNARLIIVWGSNLTESDIHTWHFMSDALDNGAKLVVIDPHFSVVASKASQWISPAPGSDVALGMSIINVLINEGLYNTDFVVNHTVGPFLVSGDTGMFLRESDVLQGGSDKYMVWEGLSGGAKPYDQASNPALTGTYTVGSTTVRPAFQLLADRISWFTPENAEGMTGVPPDVVRALAKDYASLTPASMIPSMGLDRWNNGYLMGRVIGTMAALTGNVGRSGATPVGEIAGFASMWVNNYGWTVPSGTYASSLPQALMYDAITNGSITAFQPVDPSNASLGVGPKPVQVPYVIKALFSSNGNFVSNNPDQNKIINQMLAKDKIEFFVAADMFLNDTTAYADMVLPVSSWFEADDMVSGYTHPYLIRQNKAIDPLWECKSDYQIFQLLSQKMGLGQYFQGTETDQIDSILSAAAQSLGSAGASAIADFKNNDIARFAPSPYVGYADLNFSTPSGRLEFYSEGELLQYPWNLRLSVRNGGDPLVRWEEPMEAWPTNDAAKKYPLQCFQEHTKWRVHSTWFNQPWLREVDPEPTVKMNPSDAQARGIQDGDYVEVYNDRGHAVLKVVFNPGVKAGSVNIPHGWQRSQHLAGGYQELTSSSTNPISLNFSYNDLMVEVRKVPPNTQLETVHPLGQGVNGTA